MKKFFLFGVIFNLIALGSMFISVDRAIAIATTKTIVKRVENQFVPIDFNGVKLADARKIVSKTADYARRLTQGKIGSYNKAKSLYDWITKRIAYDYDMFGKGVCFGAQKTFRTRKSICLDYSLLFSAFCSANDIKNRMVVGTAWIGKRDSEGNKIYGNHAWNEFYDSEKRKWVQVDCTFGVNGNKFDVRDKEIYKNDWIAARF